MPPVSHSLISVSQRARPAIPICKGGIRLREVRQLVEVPSQPLLPGFKLRLPDFQTMKKSHSCYSSCGLWASGIHTTREPAKMLRISPHLTSVQNVHKTPSRMTQTHMGERFWPTPYGYSRLQSCGALRVKSPRDPVSKPPAFIWGLGTRARKSLSCLSSTIFAAQGLGEIACLLQN